MVRQARIDIPGQLYHIIIRGIEQRHIYKNRTDYQEFLRRYKIIIHENDCKCFAWALMPNHAHLLMRTGPMGLSYVMSRLLTGYSMYFNKKYKRAGHLFQNRYKSILCDQDEYLMELIRYIHLNPLKAGIIKRYKDLEKYPWVGHGAIMGTLPNSCIDTETVLSLYGHHLGAARDNYYTNVEDGMGEQKDYEGGGLIRSRSDGKGFLITRKLGPNDYYDERILGGNDFVKNIQGIVPGTSETREVAHKTIEFDRIIDICAQKHGIPVMAVRGNNKSLPVKELRVKLSVIGVAQYGMNNEEIGKKLGITGSTVSKCLSRNKKLIFEYNGKKIEDIIAE